MRRQDKGYSATSSDTVRFQRLVLLDYMIRRGCYTSRKMHETINEELGKISKGAFDKLIERLKREFDAPIEYKVTIGGRHLVHEGQHFYTKEYNFKEYLTDVLVPTFVYEPNCS